MITCKIRDEPSTKLLASKDYNYIFNKVDGTFARWGAKIEDDPDYSPFGCEIADIEIGEICHKACPFCYKGNTPDGLYMPIDLFKKVISKLPPTLTQIAFGIGDIDGNPDLELILEHTRNNGVIPNITINGYRMNNYYYDLLVKHCGAVAVSLYETSRCYDAVSNLSKRGLKQVNIHALLSHETFESCLKVLKDAKTDHRLSGLNAVVFLWVKPKGRAANGGYHQVSKDQLKELISLARSTGVSFGFDSCSAPSIMEFLPKEYSIVIEPCESSLFSMYINVKGEVFPCSFCEGEHGFIEGPRIDTCHDFLKGIWNGPDYSRFRKHLIENKRVCPIFKIGW